MLSPQTQKESTVQWIDDLIQQAKMSALILPTPTTHCATVEEMKMSVNYVDSWLRMNAVGFELFAFPFRPQSGEEELN
jgi:hypothetical protein